MELQEAITTRYSCRNFTECAIDSALLKTCVETAGLAPSACNSQSWKFHIIQDPVMVAPTQPFTEHTTFIVAEEQKPVVSGRIVNRVKNQESHQADIGIMCAYLCLQTAELGLGTCMIGYFHEKKIKEPLQIPDKKRIRFVIAVGYDSQQRRKTDRKILQGILTIHESLQEITSSYSIAVSLKGRMRMDILAYYVVIGALFLLASIVDLLRSCLRELWQTRDTLRTSQLVELQKVTKEAGVETEEAAE